MNRRPPEGGWEQGMTMQGLSNLAKVPPFRQRTAWHKARTWLLLLILVLILLAVSYEVSMLLSVQGKTPSPDSPASVMWDGGASGGGSGGGSAGGH